jgi:hypothetical protein
MDLDAITPRTKTELLEELKRLRLMHRKHLNDTFMGPKIRERHSAIQFALGAEWMDYDFLGGILNVDL